MQSSLYLWSLYLDLLDKSCHYPFILSVSSWMSNGLAITKSKLWTKLTRFLILAGWAFARGSRPIQGKKLATGRWVWILFWEVFEFICSPVTSRQLWQSLVCGECIGYLLLITASVCPAKAVPNRTEIQCLQRWQKVLNPAIVKGYWTKEVSNPDQCDDYLYLIRSFKLLHVNSTFAILDIDCQFYILTGR